MPVDYTIPVPQFNVAPAQNMGAANMLTDVFKLRGLQQEQQLNALKMQEYQRARSEAATKLAEEKANKLALMQAMRGASVGDTGPQLPDMRSAANALMAQGKLSPALTALGASEAVTKDTRAKSDLAKVDAEVLDKNLGTFRTFASGVNSPEAAAIYARAMYDHPMLGPLMQQTGYDKESAAAKAAQDFATDPQRWMASHVGLTGEQVMKAIQPTQRTAAATVSAPAETPMPNPVTSAAFNAQGASPVQLAMLGGVGTSPLLQMARPMPSEGGVLAPTRVAARTRRSATAEDGESPPPAAAPKPLTQPQELKMRTEIGEARAEANESLAVVQSVLDAINDLRSVPDKDKERVLGLTGEYIPNVTGAAKLAQTKLNDIKGQVTAMAKAAAGSIGSMAVQEWEILANQIATLQAKNLDAKTLNEQLDIIESRAKGLLKRTQKNYNDTYGPVIKDSEGAFDLIMPEPRKIPERGAAATPRKGVLKAQPTLPAGVTSSGW
jgi:hypothetical protein